MSDLLVLKDGKIALERYELGNNEATRWMSMSVVKSITSTLVGVAIKDGYIKSVDDAVTKYLPKLAGSACDGVTIKNLLQMASRVKWDETYTNPASDRRHMLELQLSGKPGSILEFMATRGRAEEPGTVWNYNTGETFLVGELIHAAVKRPLAQCLSERIWTKVGVESDAIWWLDTPDGQIGGSGLSDTLPHVPIIDPLASDGLAGSGVAEPGFGKNLLVSHLVERSSTSIRIRKAAS